MITQSNLNTRKNPKGIIDPKKILLENLKLRHAVGEQLINVFFNPADPKVHSTIIELYIGDGRFERGNLVKVLNRQLIAKKTFDGKALMAAFNNLSPGVYSYKVTQTNIEGNEEISSEFMGVNLPKPNYGGKPVIYN